MTCAPDKGRIAVLDIGGTNIKAAIIEPNGHLEDSVEVPSHAKEGADVLMQVIMDVLSHYKGYDAIALSLTGQIDVDKGRVIFATPQTIPGFTGMDVRTPLERQFKVPVIVENDVNCAAIGEAYFGAGKGESQFLCVTYGTGIGGAIVLDGQVYHGTSWSAGEMGHMLVHAGEDAVQCSCGRRGCYEAYASTNALCRMAERATGKPMNGREVFAELAKGVPSPLEGVLNAWCTEVCYGLVSLIHIFNPSLIVLGGGIMHEERIIRTVRDKLYTMVLPSYQGVRITGAQLGNNAGILGVWYLAKRDINKREK